jgi:hypothetical protein
MARGECCARLRGDSGSVPKLRTSLEGGRHPPLRDETPGFDTARASQGGRGHSGEVAMARKTRPSPPPREPKVKPAPARGVRTIRPTGLYFEDQLRALLRMGRDRVRLELESGRLRHAVVGSRRCCLGSWVLEYVLQHEVTPPPGRSPVPAPVSGPAPAGGAGRSA